MQIHATTVDIRYGDLLHFPTDAIIVPLDAGGLWRGGYHQALTFAGVNGALQREAGLWFHARAAEQVLAQQGPLVAEGQTILVDGEADAGNERCFRYVIFVIDNLFHELAEIIAAGIQIAYEHGLESVALPLIRNGVMTIAGNFTVEDLVVGMAQGIRRAADDHPEQPMRITVLYNEQSDEQWSRRLPQALRHLQPTPRLQKGN